MKQRGRKSAASLEMVPVASIPRAAPPADLSAFEAEAWMAVVNTKPADWFTTDTLPLLRSYVRHVYQARKIDAEMDKVIGREFDDAIVERFEKLQKMRERESSKIMALARSMRLTQQSQYDPALAQRTAKKSKAVKVWEDA